MLRIIPMILFLLTVAALRAATVQELREQMRAKEQANLTQWRAYLDSTQGTTNAENLEQMARILRLLSDQKKFQDQRDEADRLFREVQSSVLAYPDHAEQFRRQIDEQRQQVLDGKMAWSNYHTASELAFLTFGQLPSDSTMQVLGDMLGDSKGSSPQDAFPGQARESYQSYGSNAHRAARALRQIGIKDPPDFGGRTDDWDHITPWKNWWQEVQAGTRSYHFKGTGATTATRPERRVSPEATNRRGKPSPATKQSEESPGTGLLLGAIGVLGISVIAGVALLFTKSRSGD